MTCLGFKAQSSGLDMRLVGVDLGHADLDLRLDLGVVFVFT